MPNGTLYIEGSDPYRFHLRTYGDTTCAFPANPPEWWKKL